MPDIPTCAQCGLPLPDGAAEGLCPRCLMESALGATSTGAAPIARPLLPNWNAALPDFGPYHAIGVLGEGGMGIVYLAEQREPIRRRVALKVLKRGDDRPSFIARFESERQALAVMDHPHIAHVYEAGATADGRPYFVMEYVPGIPITDYCDRNLLGFRERLALFQQVCQAVQHAHQRGIIHRDLKPSNVLVTLLDGKPVPKVIDFGVAKAVNQRLTEKTLFTETGMLIGTPEYMSPEQADLTGLDVDATTDVYSLGVLLYELLVGALPFDAKELRRAGYAEIQRVIREQEPPRPTTRLSGLGQTATEIARRRKSDVRALIRLLRGDLEWITMKALEKDRTRRYATASDFAADIGRHLASEPVSAGPPTFAYRFQKAVRRNRGKIAAGAVIAAALAIGLIPWWRYRAARQGQSPVLTRLTYDSGLTVDPAISPDGKLVAYASDRAEGNLDIWVQQVSGGPPLRITRHEADDTQPAFSPDGSQIVFRSERDGGGIYLVPTLGGEQRLFARRGVRPRFSPDGKWVLYAVGLQSGDIYAPHTRRIYVAPAAGGEHKELAANFAFAITPIWAPDSKHVLFDGAKDPKVNGADWDWWVVSLDGVEAMPTGVHEMEKRLELYAGAPEAWSPDGKEVIFSAGHGDSTNLWQVPISPRTWHAAGPARRLTTGSSLEAQPSVAQNGILAFSNVTESTNIWSLPVIADQGKISGEMQQLTTGAVNASPHLSADGRKLAFYSERPGMSSVWLKDLLTGTETAVSTGSGSSGRPALSADGSKLAFATWDGSKNTMYVVSVGPPSNNRSQEAPGAAQKVCDNCGGPLHWAYSGDKILCLGLDAHRAIVLFRPGTGQSVDLLRHPAFNLYGARFSPDDRWIVFQARIASARLQLFIAPFRDGLPGPGEREWIPVSDPSSSSREAAWSPDGNLLYFASDRDGFLCLWAQHLDPATKRPAGAPLAIHHFHDSHRSLEHVTPGVHDISVAPDKLVFPVCERTGNIWMMQLPTVE
jgi:serine/threonine protein kinase/Tol biopolymer transport system component